MLKQFALLSAVAIFMAFFGVPETAFAGIHEVDGEGMAHYGVVFFMLALVLMAGKIGNVVEQYGQPAVIGELFAGIVLAGFGFFGWGLIDEIRTNEIIGFVASFGAILLLFNIGLESNLREMRKVGSSAIGVASIGVVVPFVAGAYVIGPLLFADQSTNAHLFLGAAMVATSVGITASVFKTLGINRTRAAKTVIGAAVIDDILGLMVLAIVTALASGGDMSGPIVFELVTRSFGFLFMAVVLGNVLAKPLSKMFSKVYKGIGMKLSLAISIALTFAYFAEIFGLEPIIGAFAAGLVLDSVHFSYYHDPEVVEDLKQLEFEEQEDREKVLRVINKHKRSHVEELVNSIGLIFIPVFFVYTGLQINFGALLNPSIYLIAGVVSIAAIGTKLVAGLASRGGLKEKLLVGFSMVPRGEVGLIFAATGRSLGVLDDQLFSVIVLVVVITTFVAPTFIKKYSQVTAS
jgi:Kef-type K+ transport system membrane component KefB